MSDPSAAGKSPSRPVVREPKADARALPDTLPDALPPAQHEALMRLAIEEAELAPQHGDVPVGALLVTRDGTVVARGHNRREADHDPTSHAEIEAIRAAASQRQRWRLDDLIMVVTLEPCVMCAGALVSGRIGGLIYGCRDDKAGAIDSLFVLGRDPRLNHRFPITSGVLAEPCSKLLRDFFRARRQAHADS